MERSPAPPSESDAILRAWERSHGERLDRVEALAFHLRARAALGHALAKLDAAGIPALVVKGALLAHTLYASPIERPIRDVDLRVLPTDLARAARVLEAAPGARRRVTSRIYGSCVVSLDKIEIDLESAIGPPFVCRTGVALMLERASRTAEALGFPHLRPELHDHVLLLLVNLFKDRFVDTARWKVTDLVQLARAPGFDPEILHRRAREAECTTVVHIVAQVVAESSEEAAWAEIASRVIPARPRYAARMLSSLRMNGSPESLVQRLFARACADSRPRALAAVGASGLHEVERLLLERGHATWEGP